MIIMNQYYDLILRLVHGSEQVEKHANIFHAPLVRKLK
jgi:hypothetical protein